MKEQKRTVENRIRIPSVFVINTTARAGRVEHGDLRGDPVHDVFDVEDAEPGAVVARVRDVVQDVQACQSQSKPPRDGLLFQQTSG